MEKKRRRSKKEYLERNGIEKGKEQEEGKEN